ncbi:MAG: Na/Pi cotransporter family protein, partial [Christensenellaceae bacterium]
ACLNFFTQEVKWEIAIFHMIFNVVTTLLLLPFVKPLAKLATLLVPESKKAQKKKAATLLDERLIKSPPIAVAQIRSEIDNMGSLAFANYVSAVEMLLTGNFEGKATFVANEKTINDLNREIAAFCVKLTTQELTNRDEKKLSSFYRVISDLERIGDYAENIVEYAEKMAAEQVVFSEQAREEIRAVDDLIKQLYFKIEYAFRERDLSASAEIDAIEDQIDTLTNLMGDKHIVRMTNGECTPEAGAIYLQLSGNLERIADHMVNVSNSVKTYTVVEE